MNRTKKSFVLRVRAVLAALVFFCVCACSGVPSAAPALVSTMSLDEALAATVRAVETKVPAGTEIAVYEITTQNMEIDGFFHNELDNNRAKKSF